MRRRATFLGAVVAAVVLASSVAKAEDRQLASGPYEGQGPKVFTAANAPATPKLEDLPRQKSVSQYGITWTFETEMPVGRFITGDWYVVGPAKVVAIDPKPLVGADEVGDAFTEYEAKHSREVVVRNGSVLNPKLAGIDQGAAPFDSRLPYHVCKLDQLARPPVEMKPGDALYSTISKANEDVTMAKLGDPHIRVIKTGAILTCVAAPLPADAFRPALHDREQTIFLSRNIRRELMYALPLTKALPQAGTTPKVKSWDEALDRWARIFQRPWVDFDQWGWVNPEDNMPEYGQWVTHATAIAALMLHLDIPAEAKEKILVGYLQYGIDLWGQIRAGRAFLGHGGYGQGRKWPILFAGLLFGDERMQNPEKHCPNVTFGEDMQTYDGKSFWGHDVVFLSHPIRIKQGSMKVSADTEAPEEWNAMGNEGYRRCCTSVNWPGHALSAMMFRAESLWNHDPYFRYVDRWMTEDHIAQLTRIIEGLQKNTKIEKKIIDSFIKNFQKDIDRYKGPGYRRTDEFQQEMWNTYRNNLPPAKGK
ncbi:MAG: hypothetical protein GXY74_15920 [Phycisphaerae bacterium]|nr:hypothetical protein [Phycisphaerae bacterium]